MPKLPTLKMSALFDADMFAFLRRMTHNQLLVLAVCFICLVGNVSYVQQVLAVYPTDTYSGFLIALGCVSVLVTLVIATLFSFVMPLKACLAMLCIITASASYFVDTFGVVIDDVMIQNLFETNLGEALDLVSFSMFIQIVIIGVVPCFLLWKIQLPSLSARAWVIGKLKVLGAAITLLCLCFAAYSSYFTVFFREHKTLRFYLNPVYPIYSFAFNVNSKLKTPDDYELERFAITSTQESVQNKPKLLVVVVGETVRAQNFQLNGYAKATTPRLAARSDIVYFSDVTACGTSTAISVPCMFSFIDHESFSTDAARRQENALDILAKSGVNVLWRDNNSSSKGVADRVQFEDFKTGATNTQCDTECRDVGMLVGLEDYVQSNSGDTIIVLHQMGNHGPAYYKRYPDAFETFTPACRTKELSQCSAQEIENAYDNAVAYTDYFLDETIQLLTQFNATHDTAMLYVSDHGESLGENGIYLHGMPYMLAPETQTKVPMLVWTGEGSSIDHSQLRELQQQALSHDAVAYSLIDFFDVALQERLPEFPLLLAKDRSEPHEAYTNCAILERAVL